MILLPVGDDNVRRTFPFVNVALIVANTAVFATYAFAPEREAAAFVLKHGMIPAHWTWQTLLSSLFVHGGFAHLIGNMLFLWIAGDNVEDRLGHLGYLLFYVLAGAAAGLAHIWGNPGSQVPCVGASGAISGVMAAYLVLFPFARIKFWGLLFIIIFIKTFTFELPALLAIGFWFGEQLLLQHLAGMEGMTQVAYDAHIGGFVLGLGVVGFLRLFGMVQGGSGRET